jgi:Protein of unknown function (DUF3829)
VALMFQASKGCQRVKRDGTAAARKRGTKFMIRFACTMLSSLIVLFWIGAAHPVVAQTAVDQALDAAQPQTRAAPDAALSAQVQKSNAIIALMNRTLRISEAWDRYTSWVNLKSGPTGKEQYIDYGIYSVYDVRGEIAAANSAASQPPAFPDLDAAVKRYILAVETVSPIIDRTNGYYDRKDYKADKAAEGKVLHTKLVPAMETFNKELAALRALFRPFKADLDQRNLASIEATEGKKARWHARNVLILAERLMDRLPSPAAPIVDMKTFSEDVAEYGKAVREFDNFALDNPGTNTLSNASGLLGRFRDLQELLEKSKGDLRIAARKDMMLGQGMTLNMMVQDYNSMLQLEEAFGR